MSTTAPLPFPRVRAALPRLRGSRRRDLIEVPARADVLALAAVLLRYPDDAWCAQLDAIGAAVRALPPSRPASLLCTAWQNLSAQTPLAARQHYVEAFDLRREGAPYLSYYLHGDSRRRGMALLAIKQRYRSAGFVPDDAELPDHLPTVLEFAALAGTGAGEGVLRAHRAGLELIRSALERRESLYLHVVEAVCDVLGPLTDGQREQALAAAREGAASADLVGLGSPGLDATNGAGTPAGSWGHDGPDLDPYGDLVPPGGVDWAQCPPSSLPHPDSTTPASDQGQ